MDVSGPYRDAARCRWVIRWVDPDGKGRAMARKDRAVVEQKAAELRAQGAGTPADAGVSLDQQGAFDGSVAWVKAALAAALEASQRATEAGDVRMLSAIRKHIGNLRDALTAWGPYSGHQETQAAFEKLLDFHEANGWHREHEGIHEQRPADPELAGALQDANPDPWAALAPADNTKDN